jgi:PPM family protein phosphatase
MRLKSYAAQTHQGPSLQVNEDAYDFDFENDLYMVVDGLGGSGTGDVAVERIKAELKNFYTKISDDPNATMPLFYDPKNLLEGNALINALLSTHQNIFRLNLERPLNQRAGANLVLAARADGLMVLIGVGSCCAYHYRQGVLSKVIIEDTLKYHSQNQFDTKFRNTPMNVLGMYPDLSYQMREVRLVEGDKLLLMTDGVHTPLNDEEILHHLNRKAMDTQERINSLLKLSNSYGNLDNQTAMILEF